MVEGDFEMKKKYYPSEQMIKEIKSLLYEGNPKCSLESEKEIREEIKKQYRLEKDIRYSIYNLYNRVLKGSFERIKIKKKIDGKIAEKRDYEFKRHSTLSYVKDKSMRLIIERTNAAQPRFMSLATNMPMGSHIALLTKLPQPEIEEITPSDVDRRNWGI